MTATRRERRGEGSVHQRPNGSWCGQVTLQPDSAGRRRRKTIYAATETELRQKMRLLRRQLDDAGDLSTSDPRLETWLTDWLERIAARRVKPGTYRAYRTAVNKWITPAIGSIYLSKLNVTHVRKMHADIIDRQELSPTTARNAHAALSAALDDAMRENRVTRNVAKMVDPPAKDDSDRIGMSASTAMTLLRSTTDSRWLAALLLGLRQGERLGLRWSHVDLDAGIADLSWSLAHVTYSHGCKDSEGHTARSCPQRRLAIPAGMRHEVLCGNHVLLTPKTRSSRRVVPLLAPLVAALREQQKITGDSAHGLVWCNEDGTPIGQKQDWQDWRDALATAAIPHVTLHEARHTTATLLLELKVDAKIIAAILGHSSVVTTRGYQHASLDLSRAALEGLADRLGLPSGAATA